MINQSGKQVIGIMICEKKVKLPYGQLSFFSQLCQIGAKWGLTVYVFSPQNVDPCSSQVQGYAYEANRWVKRPFPLPDLIYDRSFFRHRLQYEAHLRAVRAMQMLKKI